MLAGFSSFFFLESQGTHLALSQRQSVNTMEHRLQTTHLKTPYPERQHNYDVTFVSQASYVFVLFSDVQTQPMGIYEGNHPHVERVPVFPYVHVDPSQSRTMLIKKMKTTFARWRRIYGFGAISTWSVSSRWKDSRSPSTICVTLRWIT